MDTAGKESAGKPEPTHPTQGSNKGPHTSPKHKQISNGSVQHPGDIQEFTPELVKKCSEDKNEDEYRYLCPHAGQFKCEVTELVFEMEGKGEVLYRIVSWDGRLFNGLGLEKPAGPLYNIDCIEGSVRELHLPHCETDKDKVELNVAHVTGGNLVIIPPLRVTNTHVVINIEHLSCFGLLRTLLARACPINAQVLLFYDKIMNKLYIHLVPGNVPVQKVQQIHERNMYIMTTSKCKLTPGKTYRPCCKSTDHDYVAQPEDEEFECDFYNYHPTFEVFFNTEVNSVRLSILDENGQVVWRPREVRFKGTEAASANMDTAGKESAGKPEPTHPTQGSNKVPHTSPKHKQISNGSVQHPGDIQDFTPELVKKCSEDKNEDEYRYLCPHAGQFKCEVTELVFEMEGKGEVLYRIVSWDGRLFNGLGLEKPAGPLYNIDCIEGSVRELHLPHCETDKDKVELNVAHVTGGNLEIIPPLRVTDTHVVINIEHLSCFGLLRTLLARACPINAQVLLFYDKIMNKLYIHLVPGNVPVQKVQQIDERNMYIMTTSKCKLTPGKTYRPCCKSTDHDYVAQPEDKEFECDFCNYHPTFEVFFNTEVNSVRLSILDENGQVVWRPREVRFKGTEAASANMETAGADFVDKHKAELIQRFNSVMEVADCLNSKHMITAEMYSKIQAKLTPQEQMRELYACLDSGGRAVKQEFYDILKRNHSGLVDDLNSESD